MVLICLAQHHNIKLQSIESAACFQIRMVLFNHHRLLAIMKQTFDYFLNVKEQKKTSAYLVNWNILAYTILLFYMPDTSDLSKDKLHNRWDERMCHAIFHYLTFFFLGHVRELCIIILTRQHWYIKINIFHNCMYSTITYIVYADIWNTSQDGSGYFTR